MSTQPLVIANVSGFYGDRLSAMREQLDGGHVDVITGDWLAELTMLILGKDTLRDPKLGYAKTFLTQLKECLGIALERNVRIVSNAGGLNPSGLAEAITELGADLPRPPKVAYVDGDDVRGTGLFAGALTANAYLGAFGIAAALDAGADVVITGRVTDAAVVMGPAIWHHGWTRSDLNPLAGALVAGHIIECGTQATGGNFSGLFDAVDAGRLKDPAKPFGFPIAEVAADGSCVITKHAETGGLVTVDTVAAQLFYEIQSSLYFNPDVTADLTSLSVSEIGPDRVQVSGARGHLPPTKLKVAVNEIGGWRNSVEFVATGLDTERKAALLRDQIDQILPATVRRTWTPIRVPAPDSPTEEGAATLLRLIVWSADAEEVSRAFTGPAIELVLASFAGFHVTSPPGKPTMYGIYRPAYIDRSQVTETVHLPEGITLTVAGPSGVTDAAPAIAAVLPPSAEAPWLNSPTTRMALGQIAYARSGDKGGNANIGLWIPQDRPADAVAWLVATVTPEWVRTLLPEAEGLGVDVVALPNLRGVNIIIRDILGAGVAEGVRFDPQAKALGEWLRSRVVAVPNVFLGGEQTTDTSTREEPTSGTSSPEESSPDLEVTR